jgi:hypothetical protein
MKQKIRDSIILSIKIYTIAIDQNTGLESWNDMNEDLYWVTKQEHTRERNNFQYYPSRYSENEETGIHRYSQNPRIHDNSDQDEKPLYKFTLDYQSTELQKLALSIIVHHSK